MAQCLRGFESLPLHYQSPLKVIKMEIKKTRQTVRQLIIALDKKGRKDKNPFYKDMALKLNKPRKNLAKVNLWKLNKMATIYKEYVLAVPGKVLGTGDALEGIEVAALAYSESAKKKIEDAKGKAMTITELMEKNPQGKKVVIVG